MRLQDKVAIVTGAGSGIGRATAALFAREGAHLVLNDIDPKGLDTVSVQLGKARHRAVAGDIAREETACHLAEEAMSAFGRIDVLVNNAGIHFLKDVTDMSVQEWDRLMDINLKSMFLCCKHVIPHMLQRKKGAIVNLASISSFIGQENGRREYLRLQHYQSRRAPAHKVFGFAVRGRRYSSQLRMSRKR